MVVDYEAAWLELHELVASKSQHGREATMVAMAEIAARNRVPAGELSRLLRLYGVEVERTRRVSKSDEIADFPPGLGSVGDDDLPTHHRTEEVHDVGRSSAAAAG